MRMHLVGKITAVIAMLTLGCNHGAEALLATYQEGVGGYTMDAAQARQGDPTNPHDTGWNLTVGGLSGGTPAARSYLGFNLTGIPITATITNITLTMTVSDGGNLGSRAVELHLLTETSPPINETQLTWNQYKSGQNWATPGGDFSPTVLSSVAVTQTSGAQTWSSTVDFVAAAQAALNTSGRLEMIVISPTAEAAGFAYKTYYDETATIGDRPILTVGYTLIPEPTSAALLALGGLIIARRRR